MAQLNFGGVTENVMTREEFPLEKAREVLKDETIAVIGYGVQGPGQACNLRDNGFNVIVGQRPGKTYEKAIADGWVPGETLFGIEEACEKGTIIMCLLSDAAVMSVWPTIKPYLTPGKALYFSHGFAITWSDRTGVVPQKDIDVIMVAPKGSRSGAVRAGQLRVRIRRGRLLLDHGRAFGRPVRQHDDPLHGRHVGRQRAVAGYGIPALRASADPLDSAYGAGDENVGVEYLALDRRGPRGDPLRLHHGYAGHEHGGRSRRRGFHRRQPGRFARRCRGHGARDDLRGACRGVEMVFLDSVGDRFRRSHRAGGFPARHPDLGGASRTGRNRDQAGENRKEGCRAQGVPDEIRLQESADLDSGLRQLLRLHRPLLGARLGAFAVEPVEGRLDVARRMARGDVRDCRHPRHALRRLGDGQVAQGPCAPHLRLLHGGRRAVRLPVLAAACRRSDLAAVHDALRRRVLHLRPAGADRHCRREPGHEEGRRHGQRPHGAVRLRFDARFGCGTGLRGPALRLELGLCRHPGHGRRGHAGLPPDVGRQGRRLRTRGGIRESKVLF